MNKKTNEEEKIKKDIQNKELKQLEKQIDKHIEVFIRLKEK